jgi:PEP-CTERM motif-containing protein
MKASMAVLAAAILGVGIGADNAHAQIVVDQSYLHNPLDISFIPGTVNGNVGTSGPLGQEFTPTLSAITFVDLALVNLSRTSSETMEVLVRAGDPINHTLNGAILGTATAVVPAGFDSSDSNGNLANLVHFSLVSTPLTPGNLYAIEVLDLGAKFGSTQAYGNTAALYTLTGRGTLIVANGADGRANLIFQEGVPEPGTLTLAGFSAVLLAGYAWRRRRQLARA